jgi:hypothetical protein
LRSFVAFSSRYALGGQPLLRMAVDLGPGDSFILIDRRFAEKRR